MQLIVKHDEIKTNLSHGELHIGKENGYTPFELLVASIAGCSAIVFRTILEKKRITYHEFIMETEVRRSEALAKPLESVHLHYKIKAEGITQEQLEKALELAMKNCTIVQSVKDSIRIIETIELIL
ncbi:TPA: OsmC family protein [Bacillus pseudomycoides]|nr:OsmC family protein [Bacillus pseudomycoides]